jgi:hypothetical protein
MLAVIRDPGVDRTLHRHRAEDREEVLDRLEGLEGTMGQEPVEADRDPRGRGHVHGQEDRQVGGGDDLVPEEDDRREDGNERDQDREQIDDLVQDGHLMLSHGGEDIGTYLVFLRMSRFSPKQLL